MDTSQPGEGKVEISAEKATRRLLARAEEDVRRSQSREKSPGKKRVSTR